MANYVEIVQYLTQPNQEYYNEEFNQTIRQLLSDIGWRFPRLTNAQVTDFTADIPIGSQWFNTDLQVMQVMTSGGLTWGGFPRLTAAQVITYTPIIPVGSQWYNTDIDKMQIMTTGGVETIQSV